MSDQDKNINEIRELLRKKLADQRTADNGWNVPSDGVWSGISEELKAEKKATKKIDRQYLLFAVIALLMSVLFMQECSNNQLVKDMKGEMEELRNNFEQLKESCEQEKTTQSKAPNINSKPQEKFTTENVQTTLVAEQSFQAPSSGKPNTFTSDKKAPYSTNIAKPQTLDQTTSAFSTSPFTLNVAAINRAAAPNTPDKRIHYVNALPQIPFLSLDQFVTLSDIDLAIPKAKHSSNSTPLIVSSYTGVSRTGNRLQGERPGIISNQRASWGQQAGLGLEIVLSPRWSVETGMRYATHQLQTDYRLEVPYTKTNEFLHDDGNYDNEYNHSLPSSMGDYPALFVLTRSSDEMVEEGETMNLDFSIRQRTRFLSVPLWLRYGFGKGNFQVGVKGGIVANRTLSISSEAKELVSHHEAIHQRHTSIGDPIFENLKKNTFDYSVGLDVRYFMTPRISVSLESTYQQGITPIYEDESVKNYFRSGNLGVGLQYRF
ncbi:MAG: outer membrane beta-barrel protein [Bacteroidota bacterium]